MRRPAGEAGLGGRETPRDYFFGVGVGAPVAAGAGEATLGLDGVISAALGRTLGALAAVAVG
ncbi:MAG: hypothetical protein K0S48_3142, partial [Ramlibacter sp.]|nr:hypothetical protein [Ramlibacter sp.]